MGFFSRVVEAISETSAAIIGRIQSSYGVSKAAIARVFGIDSSTISQIEKGKKPGANLASGLLALERKLSGEEEPKAAIKGIDIERPERLTREGEPVRVRESAADREARAEAERQAARDRELEGVMESGMTVTITGLIGSSKDFRVRTISADFDPDEAVDFLAMWDADRDQAYELFWEAALYPQLSVERLDSIQFS